MIFPKFCGFFSLRFAIIVLPRFSIPVLFDPVTVAPRSVFSMFSCALCFVLLITFLVLPIISSLEESG